MESEAWISINRMLFWLMVEEASRVAELQSVVQVGCPESNRSASC